MNKLDNFKGKSYTLTLEDRRNGGKVSSRKKTLANGLKNLKHGKNSSNYILLLRCSDCPYVFRCDRKHDGFCKYLLDELRTNDQFRKQFIRNYILNDNDLDIISLVRLKYQLNKYYSDFIQQYFE
jgi:hypothetical protein